MKKTICRELREVPAIVLEEVCLDSPDKRVKYNLICSRRDGDVLNIIYDCEGCEHFCELEVKYRKVKK